MYEQYNDVDIYVYVDTHITGFTPLKNVDEVTDRLNRVVADENASILIASILTAVGTVFVGREMKQLARELMTEHGYSEEQLKANNFKMNDFNAPVILTESSGPLTVDNVLRKDRDVADPLQRLIDMSNGVLTAGYDFYLSFDHVLRKVFTNIPEDVAHSLVSAQRDREMSVLNNLRNRPVSIVPKMTSDDVAAVLANVSAMPLRDVRLGAIDTRALVVTR